MRHAIFDPWGQFLHEEVGLYLADERRLVPVGPLEARHRFSEWYPKRGSRARCSKHRAALTCKDVYCPLHEPEAYASHQARHATDTIPPC